MNLIKYQPTMLDLVGNVDRWFDDFFGTGTLGSASLPAVDIRETEDAYLMHVDLPGLTQKDVEVKLDNNLLTVSSVKKADKEEKKNGFILRERMNRDFARSFVLPEEIDKEHISAEFTNGVLQLSFPKVPAAKPKTIEVRGA